MHTNVRRYTVPTIASLAILAAGGGAAFARTLPGLAGQAQAPADSQCFNNGNGSVWNTCATPKGYCVALPVEAGTHHIQISAKSPDAAHTMTCGAAAIDRFAVTTWTVPPHSTQTPGFAEVIDLGSTSVVSFGSLFVCCSLPTNAQLFSIDW